MIEKGLLTKQELAYFEEVEGTFWGKDSQEKRVFHKDKMDKEKQEMMEKGGERVVIEMYEGRCYIPKFQVYLEHPMDIVLLFNTRDKFSHFLNYLFVRSLNHKYKGGDSFLFVDKSRTYNFDYTYILANIGTWCSQELGVNEDEIKRFLFPFVVGNRGAYLYANFFLISNIFGDMYRMSSAKYRAFDFGRKSPYNKYFTPSIVLAGDNSEYFFYSVPFSSSEILHYLRRDIVLELFKRRSHPTLKQIAFGSQANAANAGVRPPFVRVAFL